MTSRSEQHRHVALWRRAVVRPAPVPTHLPRWLVGDWGRLIRDPLDLLRLVLPVAAVVSLLLGETTHTAELVGASFLALAPRVLDVQRPFDLAFQIGLNLALWGNVLSLFEHIYGYDKIVHFLLPCGTSMLLYIALCRVRLVPDLPESAGLHDRIAMVLITLAFGLAVGGIFEMWEWFSNTLLGTHMYVSYGDSIGDLIDDAAGALAGGLILLVWTGRGWGTWRIPGAALRGEAPVPPAPPERRGDLLARLGDRVTALRPPRGHAGARVRPLPRLPRWLAGDWHPLLRDPVDVLRAGLLAGAVASAVAGDWSHAARFAAGLGLSVVARAVEAPRPFDAAFALAMWFQVWGADELAVRALTSASVAAVLYLVLVRARAVPDLGATGGIHQRTGILLTATALGFGAGILYEIAAWAAPGVFDAGASTFDGLIGHMGIDLAASLVGAELLVAWNRAGWSTRRVPGDVLAGVSSRG